VLYLEKKSVLLFQILSSHSVHQKSVCYVISLIHYSITMANVTKEERRGQKEEKKVAKIIKASGNYNN